MANSFFMLSILLIIIFIVQPNLKGIYARYVHLPKDDNYYSSEYGKLFCTDKLSLVSFLLLMSKWFLGAL